MSDSIPSLWSKGVGSDETAPITVLRSQVAPIKDLTKGLVEAEILTWSGNDGFVYYLFDLIAPKLNLARICILGISHLETRLYPVTVQAEALGKSVDKGRGLPEVGAEASGSWSINFIRDRAGNTDWPQAKSSQELVTLIGKALQSEAVSTLIQTMVARSLKGEKLAS